MYCTSKSSINNLTTGKEKVLVVDDEESMVDLTMLRRSEKFWTEGQAPERNALGVHFSTSYDQVTICSLLFW